MKGYLSIALSYMIDFRVYLVAFIGVPFLIESPIPSVVCFVLVIVFSRLRTVSKVLRIEGHRALNLSGEERLKRASSAPILLLRSFEDDNVSYQRFRDYPYANFEIETCKLFEQLGPVIALGKPGEQLAPFGAGRIYVENDKWQEEIVAIMVKAQVILLVVGSSDSLMWEINAVFQHNFQHKTIFLFPHYLPTQANRENPDDFSFHKHRYFKFCELAQQYDLALCPEYDVELFGLFYVREEPQVLRRKSTFLLKKSMDASTFFIDFPATFKPTFQEFKIAMLLRWRLKQIGARVFDNFSILFIVLGLGFAVLLFLLNLPDDWELIHVVVYGGIFGALVFGLIRMFK